jgi:hypothetical protein
MRTITYRGRGGKRQTRCVDSEGKFVPCRGGGLFGLGRSKTPAKRRGMGYSPSWAMGLIDFDLPVVGRVNIPSTISFDFTQGLIGMAAGKVAPGLLYGILGRFAPQFAGYTKFLVGGLTGLTLLSEKYRRNSYLMGFALATFPEMIEPVLDAALSLVFPSANGNASAGRVRRMGQLNPQEAQALSIAEQALLSGSRMGQGYPTGGFVGRDIMLPSDYYSLEQPAQMSGLNPSMVGNPTLRSIA